MKRALVAVVALIAVLVVVFALFGLPVIPSLRLVAEGAFGDKFGWSRLAVKSTPLLLTGLGMVVAWRARMYNIGGEGQFVIGALCGATVAKPLLASHGLWATSLILVACAVGGGLWAWLAGWLYVKRGVAVVISTILLNFVALRILDWAVSGPLQQATGGLPLSDQLPEALMLPRFDRQMELHAGVVLALLVAFGVYVFLFRTSAGYRLRLVGENPRVARANRIDGDRVALQAIVLSGALCGLAGGVEYTGMTGQVGSGFAQGWGFLGIPVALLGALQPLIAVPSAVFFGVLFAGSENLARFTPAGTTLIYVVQAAVVLGVVALRAASERRILVSEVEP